MSFAQWMVSQGSTDPRFVETAKLQTESESQYQTLRSEMISRGITPLSVQLGLAPVSELEEIKEKYPLGVFRWEQRKAFQKKQKKLYTGLGLGAVGMIAGAGILSALTAPAGEAALFTGTEGTAFTSEAAVASLPEAEVSSLAAYDSALAAGAAEGVGVVPASTAVAPVAESSLWGTVSGGAKALWSGLGLTEAIKGFAKGQPIGGVTLQSLFKGSPDQPDNMSFSTAADQAGIGLNMRTLPYILIALTLLGAFILTRKGRKT